MQALSIYRSSRYRQRSPAGLSISTRCDQSDAAAGRGRRLCRQSAYSENRIAELKQDFGLTNFCLDAFWDTEAAFQTVLMAYNVMSLFRQALLRAPRAVKLSTMRVQCFALGAWIGRQGRTKALQISVPRKKLAAQLNTEVRPVTMSPF